MLPFFTERRMDAKCKNNRGKNSEKSVLGKNFCEFEIQKLRLKIENPSFSILSVSLKSTNVSSGKHGRLQARISGENWVWIPIWTFWQQEWIFRPVKTLKQKNTIALNNHWAFATNASQNSGNFGLLQIDCNFGNSRVQHIPLLYFYIQSWITPHFFAVNSSMLFLNANITKKTYEENKYNVQQLVQKMYLYRLSNKF